MTVPVENLERMSGKIIKVVMSDPRLARFGLETLNKDLTIPREAIASMVRLMTDLGLVDRAAAARTPAELFYDNSFVDEMKKTGFLRELWK